MWRRDDNRRFTSSGYVDVNYVILENDSLIFSKFEKAFQYLC